jgi:hypothetical protein
VPPGSFLSYNLAASGAYGGSVPICSFCGTTAPEGASTLTWTTAVENGKQRMYCESCSREHLRAMESKLDSEWW